MPLLLLWICKQLLDCLVLDPKWIAKTVLVELLGNTIFKPGYSLCCSY